MKPLYLYAHTVTRMNWRQIAGVAERKARERLVPRLPVDFDRRYAERVPAGLSPRFDPFVGNATVLCDCLDLDTRRRYRERAREAAGGSPAFLNRRLRIADGESVDWYDERLDDLPRLWRLKLYAFQPLSEAVLGYGFGEASPECRRRFDAWLRDWMRTVGIGGPAYLRNAWAPYAVSLRIQHWIRYLAWRGRVSDRGPEESDELERAIGRETFKNALFLRAHVERDVGGNHLVENGAALVAVGLLFPDHGREFLDAGLSVLAETADDQFLDDGCHYERSPMYHVLCLTRFLTVCDLLDRTGEPVPDAVRRTTAEAAGFLRSLAPPDRRIPLLNDAVHGQALPLDACLRYADAVGISPRGPPRHDTPGGGGGVTERSGYRWLRNDRGAMLVDGGPVGPPHLPGHAHSDTLSVLLWLDGEPIFTDTGTFGYQGGRRRNYARGVRGHNTVQVGETEPIALGGRFLMGPRPEPETRFEPGDVSLFEGRYGATPYDGDAYTHHRAVHAGDHWWVVQDTVRGGAGARVRGRLHLHPDVEAQPRRGGAVELDAAGPVGAVHPLDETRVETGQSRYFPRFGVSTERPLLTLSPTRPGNDTTTMRFLVVPAGIDGGGEVETDGPVPTAITVDGTRYRLPGTRLLPR